MEPSGLTKASDAARKLKVAGGRRRDASRFVINESHTLQIWRVTRLLFLFATTLFYAFAVLAQTPQPITKVDRLCGYLVTETQTGRDSISKQKVILYRRQSANDCCSTQDRLAAVQTKRDGKFEFKHISAGPYWIVAVVGGRKFRMAIDFAPAKDAQECSWNLYTIERDGTFILKTYVT